MSTTVTGQLSLSMLIESLTIMIPNIQWIQANTKITIGVLKLG